MSPSLKAYGIPGRPRLFEVVQKVKEVNAQRRRYAPGREFTGESSDATELKSSPCLFVGYVVAPPRMARYMEVSTKIYEIYLKYISAEDIHVYSVDEVFMDVTNYLGTYHLTARELAMKMILDVLHTTGITATAGIGTNLYLCKVAMDIQAKHIAADKNGVRIAELDEMSYRQLLWPHRPLTDFWRVGRGYAKKLEACGLYTMGDVARCSIADSNAFYNEMSLYKMFGINAELLIDHAWGWEPCTIADIKAYKPSASSLGSGQVLQCPYSFEKGKVIIYEMAELLSLDLLRKKAVTNQVVLNIGYDMESLTDPAVHSQYHGSVTTDHYGRSIPKPAHGSANLGRNTSSTKLIVNAALNLYARIVDPKLLIRRVYVVANNVVDEKTTAADTAEQLDLFSNFGAAAEKKAAEDSALKRERKMQEAVLNIKQRYGKNAILKGINFEEGATTIERNRQIGGHKADGSI